MIVPVPGIFEALCWSAVGIRGHADVQGGDAAITGETGAACFFLLSIHPGERASDTFGRIAVHRKGSYMIIFLTSSPTGPLDGSRKVEGIDEKNGFREHLRQFWKEKARCLMIAASPDEAAVNDEMKSWMADTFEKSGLSITTVDLWDGRTTDVSQQTLNSYDVVILGGGHVPTENLFFERIGLREKMRAFHGVVIGISAGTMNSADEVYAQPEMPGEAVDPGYQRFLTGLGLTKTRILPHYQMLQDSMLDGMRLSEEITFEDSYGRTFLVLTDGSYLFCRNGQETVYGEAYVISDGRMEPFCEDGQAKCWNG